MPGGVGHDRKGESHRADAAYGQPVHAVREVDRVAGAHYHQDNETNRRQQRQLRHERRFKERHHQARRELSGGGEDEQDAADQHAPENLQQEFPPGAQPAALVPDNFRVIVGKADRSQKQHRGGRRQEKLVGRYDPENRGKHDGADDEQPAHGRGAFFAAAADLVQGGHILAETGILAAAHVFQPADEKGPQQQAENKGRPGRGHHPHGNILEDAQV